MAGIRPLQLARLDVELSQLPRDELPAAIVVPDRRFKLLMDGLQQAAMTAIMAVAPQGETSQNGRIEAVPHGVHERNVEHRPIDRIVEATPPQPRRPARGSPQRLREVT